LVKQAAQVAEALGQVGVAGGETLFGIEPLVHRQGVVAQENGSAWVYRPLLFEEACPGFVEAVGPDGGWPAGKRSLG